MIDFSLNSFLDGLLEEAKKGVSKEQIDLVNDNLLTTNELSKETEKKHLFFRTIRKLNEDETMTFVYLYLASSGLLPKSHYERKQVQDKISICGDLLDYYFLGILTDDDIKSRVIDFRVTKGFELQVILKPKINLNETEEEKLERIQKELDYKREFITDSLFSPSGSFRALDDLQEEIDWQKTKLLEKEIGFKNPSIVEISIEELEASMMGPCEDSNHCGNGLPFPHNLVFDLKHLDDNLVSKRNPRDQKYAKKEKPGCDGSCKKQKSIAPDFATASLEEAVEKVKKVGGRFVYCNDGALRAVDRNDKDIVFGTGEICQKFPNTKEMQDLIKKYFPN